MKKDKLITILIILLVLIISFFLLKKSSPETTEEIAKCIGKNSILYVQLGCIHCENQKELFGESVKYLEIVDCWFEKEKCNTNEITATPTWIINNKKYEEVQSIKKLQKLTGC